MVPFPENPPSNPALNITPGGFPDEMMAAAVARVSYRGGAQHIERSSRQSGDVDDGEVARPTEIRRSYSLSSSSSAFASLR